MAEFDQSGKVANPARYELNRENELFSVPVCAEEETGLASGFEWFHGRPGSVGNLETF